jgi:hypothetical protein
MKRDESPLQFLRGRRREDVGNLDIRAAFRDEESPWIRAVSDANRVASLRRVAAASLYNPNADLAFCDALGLYRKLDLAVLKMEHGLMPCLRGFSSGVIVRDDELISYVAENLG